MRTKGIWDHIEIELLEGPAVAITGPGSFDDNLDLQFVGNDGIDLAHCFGPDRESNAILMSAAPELATAIDSILRHGLTKETRKKASAALRKARTKAGADDTAKNKGHNV